MARAAEGKVREAVVLPPGFRVRMNGAAAPRLQGFQLAAADAGPVSQADVWERLAGRVRSAPSVVTEFDRLLAEHGRVAPGYRDRYEVDLYNAKIAALMGLHREGWEPMRWDALAAAPRLAAPARPVWREQQAAHALASFQPTLQEKLLGAGKRRGELEHALAMARAQDEAEHLALMQMHHAELARQDWFRKVAIGVTQGDLASCQAALDHLGPFKMMRGFGSSLNVVITRSWCAEAWLIGNTNGVIPNEEEGWTPSGKRSSKKLSNTRYWEIYQDHVCSAALSIARETFAILPLPYALVHVGFPFDNPRTGHPDCAPSLSVAVERATFLGLNLQRIDPSDAMANFPHRMQFKKSSGMEPVEALTPADLGVAED